MGFLIPAGTNSGTSPDEITRKRQLAQALLGDALKPEEMRSPLQGVGDLGEAFVSALLNRRANSQERMGTQRGDSLTNRIVQILAGNQASPDAPPAPMAATPSDPVNARINQGFDVAGEQPYMTAAQNAIDGIESKGSGDYSALGPITKTGDRAYGKYQVMGANIPQWTKEILGQEMDPQAFLASPEAQDAVFKGKFGQYQQQTGSPSDAASMWFTGRPQAQGGAAQDQLGTSGNDYVAKFLAAGGAGNGGQSAETPANAGMPGGADKNALLAQLLGSGGDFVDPSVRTMLANRMLPPVAAKQDQFKSVSQGSAIYDTVNQKWITPPGASASGGDADTIASAIANGDQPPVLTGLYRLGGPVRAALEAKGFNLTAAQQDWTATQKLLNTMNGAQQTRLRQAVGQVKESLPLVQELADKWDAGGYPALNRAQLILAKQGAFGPDAQSIATQLEAEIADITSELGTVYKGGNSSTDESLKLAATQLSADWSPKQLRDAIALAQKNITYRENSLRLGTAGIENSQYNQTQSSPEIAPEMGTAPAPAPGAVQTTAPAANGAPAVGTVEGGYRFKGGDPADQKNWEAVQ